MRNFFYITDLSLPSNKAQAVHIFKMLDNFQDFSKKVVLISPFTKKITNIKKKFNLHSKKKIIIHSVFKEKFVNSFFKKAYICF